MNILEMTARADYGGGPEHLYLLEKFINKSKFNIYTACPYQEPYTNNYIENSKGVIEIPFRKFNFFAVMKLIEYAKKNKIDLIHSHGKGAGIYSRLVGIATGMPVIHTPHGLTNSGKGRLKSTVYNFQERIFSLFTQKIINVSESEKRFALNKRLFTEDKCVDISNGIDISKFLINVDSCELRESFGIGREDFVIGNISRLCREKGVIDLINAFKRINIKSKKLILIGDGELREEVQSSIIKNNLKGDVILLGFRNDIPELLYLIDVYVSTSYGEGLPITLLEAMSCKKPIVATNVVGNNEVVKDGFNGLLCEVSNPNDVAEKVERLYKHFDYKELGENGYKILMEKYDVKKMVEKIEDLYIQLIASK